MAKLTASDPNTRVDGFSVGVDLSGNRLVVADNGFNDFNDFDPLQGAAYACVKTLTGWQLETKLIVSDRAPYDNCGGQEAIEFYDNVPSPYFGAVIAAANETIMVSASAHNDGRGVAYLLFNGILFKDGFEYLAN